MENAAQDPRHPVISLPLTRQPSRARYESDRTHLSSPITRPTSPPPRGYRSKPFFSLIRRSGYTLDSVPAAAEDDELGSDTPKKKGKGRGRERWSKRASRKAPPPPTRERGESEELDWERIRTLPRVRLVPPEDEGEPIILYPIPHPSSLLPSPSRPQSPPTLLSATVAATLATTDPSATTSPPTPPKPLSPPEGVVPNSLAHATFMSQQHGHWIGMSDKFILPPPVFSRGPTAASARAGIVMPKTRRQLEADIGRRMSMVEQRKRDSLELERTALLPPPEEATQSPPNIMMPPVLRSIAEDGEIISVHDFGSLLDADDELPLAAIKRKSYHVPIPPPRSTSHPVAVVERELSTAIAAPTYPAPITLSDEPILGPAIRLKSPPKRTSSRDNVSDDTLPPLKVQIKRPSAEATPLPIPPAPAPTAAALAQVPMHPPSLLPAPPPKTSQFAQAAAAPLATRTKRSKSLSAALSRSLPDDTPFANAAPAKPLLKRQKSLKKLFTSNFGNQAHSVPSVPPVPLVNDPGDQNSLAKRRYIDLDRDGFQPAPAATGKAKKTASHSRTKSKPSLRIEVQPTPPAGEVSVAGIAVTPALTTASSAGHSDAQLITPILPTGSAPPRPIKGKVTKSTREPPSDREQATQSAGGVRGLSKRFSISNMSGAFRKRASISTMVALPSETEVPRVPDIPVGFKKGASGQKRKGKDKGKQRAIDPDIDAALAGAHASAAPLVLPMPIEGEWLSSVQAPATGTSEESCLSREGPSIAGPSRTATRSDGARPAHDDTVVAFGEPDMSDEPTCTLLDLQHEFAYSLPASYEGQASTKEAASRLLDINAGPHNLNQVAAVPAESHPQSRRSSVDTDALSISSCSSLDDTEHSCIVHAQLMQVSPTTRRDLGVSLHEFLGSAPIPQVGVLVSTPADKRRSVQAVVHDSSRESIDTPRAPPPDPRKSSKQIMQDQQLCASPSSARTAMPLVIDLRGQYLKRICPSGSKGAHILLERALAEAMPVHVTVPEQGTASLRRPVSDIPTQPGPEITFDCIPDDRSSDAESDKDDVPATPTIEDLYALVGGMPSIDPGIANIAMPIPSIASLASSDSGLVIVDIPSPRQSPDHPHIGSPSAAMTVPPGSRASTPRSIFTTPDTLLRLLTSPLVASRLSRSSPGSSDSSKSRTKKSLTSMPVSPGLEGMPHVRDAAEIDWNAMLAQTQLGSLHFDGLGLDLAFSPEAENGVSEVG